MSDEYNSEGRGSSREDKNPPVGSTFFSGAIIFISFAVLALIGYQFYQYDQSVRGYKLCVDNLKRIGTALEMYSTDNSGHYPEKMELLVPNYMASIPTCPAANKDTYSGVYQMFR